jgi:predicted permease
MPDFRKIVQDRLAILRLDPAEESTLIDELAQHLEDRYQHLLASGHTEGEACRQAAAELEDVRQFSGKVRQSPRIDPVPAGDVVKGSILADLARDLRYAVRTMRGNLLFVTFVVLTLALGIGANATVFTVIHSLILNPFPVQQPEALVALATTKSKSASKANTTQPTSYANLKDYKERNEVFQTVAAYTSPRGVTFDPDASSQRLFASFVTEPYFSTLGIAPAKGRFFLPEEHAASHPHAVAVMNHATWQARFGGNADIIGKTLRLNNLTFTIVGIAPPRFIGVDGIFGPDLWIPAAMADQLLPAEMTNALTDRGKPLFQAVARLKPGVNPDQAQAHLATIASALEKEYPEVNAGQAITVSPLAGAVVGDGDGQPNPMIAASIGLLAVVAIVLLIACSNVANLLLARSAARRHELTVRLALGASRARLVRQLLTESVVLALLSGTVGVVLGYFGTQLLWSFRPPEYANNLVSPKLDVNVVVFTLALSVLTGFLFGIVPALRSSQIRLSESLSDAVRTTGRTRRRVTLANALLVGQVALSLVCLTTAALFLRSIQRAYEIDPGFDTRHLAIFMTNAGQTGLPPAQTPAFYKQARERVGSLPGISSASWASNLPLWGRVITGLQIEGVQQRSRTDTISAALNTVDIGYFATTGIAIIRGRSFSELDAAHATPVAIVNEKLARDYWPHQDPIGKRIQLPDEKAPRQVIGVAKTANYSALGEPPQFGVYIPLSQNMTNSMILYVRASGDPEQTLAAVQRELRSVNPAVVSQDARTGNKIVDQALFGSRIGVTMLSVFGLLALVLASIGLYGVIAYSITRRKREIGVRMAVGAAQGAVIKLVLTEGMSLVLAGAALGMAAAFGIGQMISGMLFGVSATDPASLLIAASVLLVVAGIACYLPARAASRLDPLVALREG